MLKIQGKQTSSGSVTIPGSKNAMLPLFGAALLVDQVTFHNVPDISDTHLFIRILKSLGSQIEFQDHTLTIDNSNLSLDNLETEGIGKARATYYLVPGLLYRFGKADIPYPGGCNLGKRPLDDIIRGFQKLGYTNDSTDDTLSFDTKNLPGDTRSTNTYFSVGATVNMILASVVRPGKSILQACAFEPHIFSLIDFLRSAGADISVRYDHTIIINGGKELRSGGDFTNISDYLVSGTFAIIGALTAKDYIDIHNARIEDLTAFLHKLHEAGVKTEDMGNDVLRVYRAHEIKPVKIQTNIYPGFPTDLQSPFLILMTQAEGVSEVHEILFEGRLNWLIELESMRGQYALLNPHKAMIFGKRNLIGAKVNSWDLRSGAAMMIAGLIAEGETFVDKINHIERGYEKITDKLADIGIKIENIS